MAFVVKMGTRGSVKKLECPNILNKAAADNLLGCEALFPENIVIKAASENKNYGELTVLFEDNHSREENSLAHYMLKRFFRVDMPRVLGAVIICGVGYTGGLTGLISEEADYWLSMAGLVRKEYHLK